MYILCLISIVQFPFLQTVLKLGTWHLIILFILELIPHSYTPGDEGIIYGQRPEGIFKASIFSAEFR